MNTSTSLLFIICIAFYFEMRRRMSTMGMLQISTMNYAWLRLAAQAFPQHIYKLHDPHKIPNSFHTAGIHKQKITISTQIRSAMLKACPMTAWLG
jgi:hypothetical protein